MVYKQCTHIKTILLVRRAAPHQNMQVTTDNIRPALHPIMHSVGNHDALKEANTWVNQINIKNIGNAMFSEHDKKLRDQNLRRGYRELMEGMVKYCEFGDAMNDLFQKLLRHDMDRFLNASQYGFTFQGVKYTSTISFYKIKAVSPIIVHVIHKNLNNIYTVQHGLQLLYSANAAHQDCLRRQGGVGGVHAVPGCVRKSTFELTECADKSDVSGEYALEDTKSILMFNTQTGVLCSVLKAFPDSINIQRYVMQILTQIHTVLIMDATKQVMSALMAGINRYQSHDEVGESAANVDQLRFELLQRIVSPTFLNNCGLPLEHIQELEYLTLNSLRMHAVRTNAQMSERHRGYPLDADNSDFRSVEARIQLIKSVTDSSMYSSRTFLDLLSQLLEIREAYFNKDMLEILSIYTEMHDKYTEMGTMGFIGVAVRALDHGTISMSSSDDACTKISRAQDNSSITEFLASVSYDHPQNRDILLSLGIVRLVETLLCSMFDIFYHNLELKTDSEDIQKSVASNCRAIIYNTCYPPDSEYISFNELRTCIKENVPGPKLSAESYLMLTCATYKASKETNSDTIDSTIRCMQTYPNNIQLQTYACCLLMSIELKCYDSIQLPYAATCIIKYMEKCQSTYKHVTKIHENAFLFLTRLASMQQYATLFANPSARAVILFIGQECPQHQQRSEMVLAHVSLAETDALHQMRDLKVSDENSDSM